MKQDESHRWLEDGGRNYYVILPLGPKIAGHILIISKEPLNDITKLDTDNISHVEILKAVAKWCKKLKEKLHLDEDIVLAYTNAPKVLEWTPALRNKLTNPSNKVKKVEKVYVMTICEHWKQNEIISESKQTTEHLHFHLLPRYEGMRTLVLAKENLFMRCEEKGWDKEMFEAVKRNLC